MRIENRKLFAQAADGSEVCIADGGEKLSLSYVTKLTEVSGTHDGATCVAEVITPCLETSMSKTESVRLNEPANKLARAFHDVGLNMPKVEKPSSASVALSLFTGGTAPNLYSRLESAAKSAAKIALK